MIIDRINRVLTSPGALIRRLSRSARDVKDAEWVPRSKLLFLDRTRTLNIVDLIAVTDELGRLRWHELEAGEFVDGVERIRWLPLCYKLDYVSLCALNIIVSQVVLWLVKANV